MPSNANGSSSMRRPAAGGAAGSELDGFATAARTLGVGIVELEAVAHHPAHEVELHAAEIDQALGVDHDRDPVLREHLVGGAGLLGPLEHVGEAGAAAAAHA